MDDFIIRAFVMATMVTLVAGPLGCILIWRRMAYFGDTISHSALLGIAIAILLNINLAMGVLISCVAIALLLYLTQKQKKVADDALLGILSHSSLALGILLLSLMPQVRADINGYLFGDLLAVTWQDIYFGAAVLLVTGTLLFFNWRKLIALCLSEELAKAEGINIERQKLLFILLVALTVAMAMKIIGILLITALLIIPASTARLLSRSPEGMALSASGIGLIAIISGLTSSYQFDTTTGPSIVVSAAALFFFTYIIQLIRHPHEL